MGKIIRVKKLTKIGESAEEWLFDNKTALASVDKGMTESANGQVVDRGSFARYAKDSAQK